MAGYSGICHSEERSDEESRVEKRSDAHPNPWPLHCVQGDKTGLALTTDSYYLPI